MAAVRNIIFHELQTSFFSHTFLKGDKTAHYYEIQLELYINVRSGVTLKLCTREKSAQDTTGAHPSCDFPGFVSTACCSPPTSVQIASAAQQHPRQSPAKIEPCS